MSTRWLLGSSFIWGALIVSGTLSTVILWLSPDGLGALHRRKQELRHSRDALLQVIHKNRDLAEEVKRLAARDPELFEHLARSRGYARPGESIYTFRERGDRR